MTRLYLYVKISSNSERQEGNNNILTNSEPASATRESKEHMIVKSSSPALPKRTDGLPKRLITVTGLESSGTVFMWFTLAKALGLEKSSHEECTNRDRSIIIQHLSLPSGFKDSTEQNNWKIWPVNVLYECRDPRPSPVRGGGSVGRNHNPLSEDQCNNIFGGRVQHQIQSLRHGSRRYFVNLTSHIQWYREHGVDTTVVIIVRDAGIRIHGAKKACRSDTECLTEYYTGRDILRQAIDLEGNHPNSVVLVSYETLMSIQKPYLFQIYRELGLDNSTTFVPQFNDGNLKHLAPDVPSTIIRDSLILDVGDGVDMKTYS